jgi:hypothetical protein
MGAWADDTIHFAWKTGTSVRSPLRCNGAMMRLVDVPAHHVGLPEAENGGKHARCDDYQRNVSDHRKLSWLAGESGK